MTSFTAVVTTGIYCRAAGCDLKLNVAYPANGKGPFPAVLLIHGGGWIYGSHYDHARFAVRLAERGYVAGSEARADGAAMGY